MGQGVMRITIGTLGVERKGWINTVDVQRVPLIGEQVRYLQKDHVVEQVMNDLDSGRINVALREIR